MGKFKKDVRAILGRATFGRIGCGSVVERNVALMRVPIRPARVVRGSHASYNFVLTSGRAVYGERMGRATHETSGPGRDSSKRWVAGKGVSPKRPDFHFVRIKPRPT